MIEKWLRSDWNDWSIDCKSWLELYDWLSKYDDHGLESKITVKGKHWVLNSAHGWCAGLFFGNAMQFNSINFNLSIFSGYHRDPGWLVGWLLELRWNRSSSSSSSTLVIKSTEVTVIVSIHCVLAIKWIESCQITKMIWCVIEQTEQTEQTEWIDWLRRRREGGMH